MSRWGVTAHGGPCAGLCSLTDSEAALGRHSLPTFAVRRLLDQSKLPLSTRASKFRGEIERVRITSELSAVASST
jgi:hypothetical protein